MTIIYCDYYASEISVRMMAIKNRNKKVLFYLKKFVEKIVS